MHKTSIWADCQDACGEAPLWDDRFQTLFWADITTNRLHRKLWDSASVHTIDPGVAVSALALTEDDSLIACGSNGIWLLRAGGEAIPLAQQFGGQPLCINDCLVDERGRLLAGSTFFDGTASYPEGHLYSLDNDTLSVLDSGFRLANGMGFSPDGRTLYVTDSAVRRIYAYSYDADSGKAIKRSIFIQESMNEGLPDGLTVDAEGYVWSAQWFGACVSRYRPDGTLERRISIPADQVSSLTFGGPGYTDLFITTASVPDALSLAPSGYQPSPNIGGQLYRTNVSIAGRPENRFRVSRSA